MQTLGTRELFFVLLKHLRAKARDKAVDVGRVHSGWEAVVEVFPVGQN